MRANNLTKLLDENNNGNNTSRYLLKPFELLHNVFSNCLITVRMLHNCTTRMCILRSYLCDGISDCPDQSDEHDCDYVKYTNDTSRVCVDLYYHCRSESGSESEIYST